VSKIFGLDNRKRFGENVRNHIFSGTINEIDGVILNTKLDEMVADVDVLGTSMELTFRISECTVQ
jgi:hypothetical protein